MGLLDRVEGIVIDKAASAVLDMVMNHPGQAHEIAARLGQLHLGENLHITADQIQGVLAEEHIAAVAQRLGISQQEAAAKIAELLPAVLNEAK